MQLNFDEVLQTTMLPFRHTRGYQTITTSVFLRCSVKTPFPMNPVPATPVHEVTHRVYVENISIPVITKILSESSNVVCTTRAHSSAIASSHSSRYRVGSKRGLAHLRSLPLRIRSILSSGDIFRLPIPSLEAGTNCDAARACAWTLKRRTLAMWLFSISENEASWLL